MPTARAIRPDNYRDQGLTPAHALRAWSLSRAFAGFLSPLHLPAQLNTHCAGYTCQR